MRVRCVVSVYTLCVRVSVRVHVIVYVCACAYVLVHACMCTWVCMCACVHISMCLSMVFACKYECVHARYGYMLNLQMYYPNSS